jgi:hypothetical protein
MPASSVDIAQWWNCAEEMRTLAEDMRDPNCRAMAVRLAEGYERLPHRAEQTPDERNSENSRQ